MSNLIISQFHSPQTTLKNKLFADSKNKQPVFVGNSVAFVDKTPEKVKIWFDDFFNNTPQVNKKDSNHLFMEISDKKTETNNKVVKMEEAPASVKNWFDDYFANPREVSDFDQIWLLRGNEFLARKKEIEESSKLMNISPQSSPEYNELILGIESIGRNPDNL